MELFINIGGRFFGMYFDFLGNLLVVDVDKGLFFIDLVGKMNILVMVYDELVFGIIDDVEVGWDGKIYFLDVLYCFYLYDYKLDILEYWFNGCLLEYDLVL